MYAQIKFTTESQLMQSEHIWNMLPTPTTWGAMAKKNLPLML